MEDWHKKEGHRKLSPSLGKISSPWPTADRYGSFSGFIWVKLPKNNIQVLMKI